MSEQNTAGHRLNPRDARLRAGLTQTQAAQLIGGTLRAWQCWEGGQRVMPPAKFALFVMLTQAQPQQEVRP